MIYSRNSVNAAKSIIANLILDKHFITDFVPKSTVTKKPWNKKTDEKGDSWWPKKNDDKGDNDWSKKGDSSKKDTKEPKSKFIAALQETEKKAIELLSKCSKEKRDSIVKEPKLEIEMNGTEISKIRTGKDVCTLAALGNCHWNDKCKRASTHPKKNLEELIKQA